MVTDFILWLFHTFFFTWIFFEKLKTSVEVCFLHNGIFVKCFYEESKIKDHIFK